MDASFAMVVLASLLVGALIAAAGAAWVATRRGFRMLRAIQIAEMALSAAKNEGPRELADELRIKLHNLKWEIGIEDNVLAPPMGEEEGREDPEVGATIGDDGAVTVEWIAEGYRLGVSIGPELADSCWWEASHPFRPEDGSGHLRDGVAPFRERLAALLRGEEG